MTRAQQTWIIVAALFLCFGTLIYVFAPSATPVDDSVKTAISVRPELSQTAPELPKRSIPERTEVRDLTTPASAPEAPTGPPFTEKLEDGIALTFVPTAKFRRLVEYRQASFSSDEDPSCTAPYSLREKVTKVKFAWGFVIDRFWTWSDKEGKAEYIVDEAALPRVWQGSLHDIVTDGRVVTVTKQRCGQGQVAGLVAVKL